MKKCVVCGIDKAMGAFRKDRRYADGLSTWCRTCKYSREKLYWAKPANERRKFDYMKRYLRDYDLRKKYGITLDEYKTMAEEQNFLCFICGKSNEERSLNVDHDHSTGLVRKLLCDACNTALGHVRESITILESMINYVNMFTPAKQK